MVPRKELNVRRFSKRANQSGDALTGAITIALVLGLAILVILILA